MAKTICITWQSVEPIMYLGTPTNPYAGTYGDKQGLRFSTDGHKLLADGVKTTDDLFVFVLTLPQYPYFTNWLKKYDLEKAIVMRHEKPVWNFNYPAPAYTPRLHLCVLKGMKE